MAGVYNITWNSKPDFDEWGPDDYWEIIHWQQWMNALIDHYGWQEGIDRWYQGWSTRLGTIETFGDVRGDWVALNPDYRQWLSQYELSNGHNLLEAVKNNVVLASVFSGTQDTVSNVAGAVKNSTSLLKYVLPIAVAAALAILLYGLYNIAKTGKLKLI